MAKKYAFLVDLRRCLGCNSCQVSCKMENGVPVGKFRTRVGSGDVGSFPNAKRYFLPSFCNHCDKPSCILKCPVPGATYQKEDGTVVIDRNLCIGCGKCVDDCPYGARFMHPHIPIKNDPKPFFAKVPELKKQAMASLRVADKCDWCEDRRAQGFADPACVSNCFGKALVFGDRNDPNSRVAKLIASEKTVVLFPDLGTKPQVLYIAPDPAVFRAAEIQINDD